LYGLSGAVKVSHNLNN